MRLHRIAFACLLTVACWLPTAQAEEVEITDRARELFAAGVALLEDADGPRYEEAYRTFKSAYEESPSPKILGNLGLCAMKLERDGEAIRAYQRYLAKVEDISEEERAQIERDLGVLTASSAVVIIETDREGFEIVDERLPAKGAKVRNVYGPFEGRSTKMRLRAGDHQLQIKGSGGATKEVSLLIEPGDEKKVQVELTEPEPTEGEPAPASPLPIDYQSRPLTLPAGTVAPALRVRAGQTVEGGERAIAVGLDLVNLRVGVIDNLEIDGNVAPFEVRPRLDYGTATVRGTYRFLDEVVELGSALRMGHVLFPGQTRRFLLEPQVLRMLAHAGSSVRIDSGFSLPMYFGGPTAVIGMAIPADVAIQAMDLLYFGLGTGIQVTNFSEPGPNTVIPASAFVGATVPLDNRPLLDIGGRFSMPLLFLPGRADDKLEERIFEGIFTFRLYFFFL